MKDESPLGEPNVMTMAEWLSSVLIFHVIALAAFLFGCLIGYAAFQAGASIVLVLFWPLVLTALAYGASIFVLAVVGGRTIGDLKKVAIALFMPSVFVKK